MVFIAIEAGGSQPILPCKFVGVFNFQAPLFGTVDDEETTERPKRLRAEIRSRLLLDDENSLPAIGKFRRCNQAGESGADDDDVGIHVHGVDASTLLRKFDERTRRCALLGVRMWSSGDKKPLINFPVACDLRLDHGGTSAQRIPLAMPLGR